MDYILFAMLTNILFVGILFIYKKNKYKSIEYTQSNIHQIVKKFIPKDFFELPRVVSQSTKHVDKNIQRMHDLRLPSHRILQYTGAHVATGITSL